MTKLALAIACVLAIARPAAAQNADVDILGQWEITVTMAGQGPLTPAPLVLKKEGDKIVGTLTRTQGDLAVEATVKDKAVTISFTAPTQSGPLRSRSSARPPATPAVQPPRCRGRWTSAREDKASGRPAARPRPLRPRRPRASTSAARGPSRWRRPWDPGRRR